MGAGLRGAGEDGEGGRRAEHNGRHTLLEGVGSGVWQRLGRHNALRGHVLDAPYRVLYHQREERCLRGHP